MGKNIAWRKTTKEKGQQIGDDTFIGAKTAGVASLMSFGRFVALFMSGIAFVIVARVLGPSVYGIYTLAIAYSGFFTAGLADLGISTTFSKFIGQYSGKGNKTEIEKVISNGYAVAIISGLILTVVALLLSNVVAVFELKDASLTYVVQIVSFAVVLGMLFNISYNALVGFGKGIYIALAIIVQSFSQAIVSIALAILGYGALAPIIGLLAGYLSAIIFAFAIFNAKFGIKFRMPSLPYMKKLVSFSYPIAVYNSLRGLVSNLSPIVLGLFVTIAIVGNFGVALRTSAIISNITDALGLAVLPMFAYTAATKSNGIRNAALISADKNTFVSLTISGLTPMSLSAARTMKTIVRMGVIIYSNMARPTPPNRGTAINRKMTSILSTIRLYFSRAFTLFAPIRSIIVNVASIHNSVPMLIIDMKSGAIAYLALNSV